MAAPMLPSAIISIGGRFGYDDDGQTPNTQILYYDYHQVPILYEVHNLPKSKADLKHDKWRNMPDFKGQRTGVSVQCEGGYTQRTAVYDNAGKQLPAPPMRKR